MASLFLIAACLVAQTGATEYKEPEPEINWITNTDQQTYYQSTLSIPRLLATPEWKADEENPPLSARKAIATASEVVQKLAPYGKDAKVSRGTVRLRESHGRWYWVVFFSADDWRRFQSTFPVVVLMDGKAITPQRIPPPPQKFGDP